MPGGTEASRIIKRHMDTASTVPADANTRTTFYIDHAGALSHVQVKGTAMKQYATYTIDSLGYAAPTGTKRWQHLNVDVGRARLADGLVMKMSGRPVTDYAEADGKWVTTATNRSTRLK
jgi:hypothetical protein